MLDLAYEIPSKKDVDEELLITIALEHKSQGGLRSERETLEQLFYYFALLCRRQRFETGSPSDANAPTRRRQKRRTKRAQPIVVLLYTGSNLNYEPPKWEDYYPLPKSLSQFQVRFPIRCVNWTKAYREGQIGGSPLIRIPAGLLAASSLKELPESFAQTFSEANSIEILGDREHYLLNAYYSYLLKAFNNMKLGFTPDHAKSIRAVIQNERTWKEMEAIIGDIVLDARRETLMEERAGAIARMLTYKFHEPHKKTLIALNSINDLSRLEDIFKYVLLTATDLADAERFIQSKLAE